MDVRMLGSAEVLRGSVGDVARQREAHRGAACSRSASSSRRSPLFLYWRWLGGNPVQLGWPHLVDPGRDEGVPARADPRRRAGRRADRAAARGRPVAARALPPERDRRHVRRRRRPRPGQGRGRQDAQPVPRATRRSATRMGGNPRKAILFEGPPGTGKTYMAKAMAREAGVPFLFVSSTAFQSMYYGQTGRKIRNYFKALRKAAREEGGAIGFIEEIDAIAGARSGMSTRRRPTPARRAVSVERADVARGHLRCRQRAADPAAVVRRADARRAGSAAGSIDRVNRLLPAAPPDPQEAADRRRTSS